MKSLLACLTLALLASTAGAFSMDAMATNAPAASTGSSRRDWLASTVLATTTSVLGFPVVTRALPPSQDLTTYNDALHGFSIAIPSTWSKSETELNDRRKIVVWGDPNDAKTALFIAYTPVRDDFTSLGSFGAVDQVAAQTILPKAELAGQEAVQAKMIAAVSAKQAYLFDYTQAIVDIQPPTHFRTIFTLQQGATGGAGAVLVTITLQTPEERYAASLKPLFDKIIDSYGKNV
jgi:PsbP